MNNTTFERDNDLVRRSCEKLYMNSETADLSFVFGIDTEHVETLPAHKILLSVGSPVFEAMLYGSMKEKGDIPIVDASIEAFKEFLQFFYLTKVRITSNNVGEVINLCNKYELLDALKACEMPLQKSLTINDMCWGYELAILLELGNVKSYCEQKIKENAHEILVSDGFLESDLKGVERILQLVDKRCAAKVIVDACMKWAVAENERTNTEASSKNLRAQLGPLFDRIPFCDLSVEHVFDYISKYREIMSDSEIDSIVKVIAAKNNQSSIYADAPISILPRLECDRRVPGDEWEQFDFKYGFICFESNKDLLLREFYLPKLPSNQNDNVRVLDVFCNIYGPFNCLRSELTMFQKVTLTSADEKHIVLPQPVVIEAEKMYCINVVGTHFDLLRDCSYYQRKELEKTVTNVDGDVEIKFFPGSHLSSRLIFQQPKL